jgi:hypothetical protein
LCFHRRQNIRTKNLKELKEKTSFLSSLCVDCGGEGNGRKGGWFNYAVNRRMGSSAQNHVLNKTHNQALTIKTKSHIIYFFISFMWP